MDHKKINIEELNYKFKFYDFMSLDYLAFSLSTILIIFSIAIISVIGFNWGLDFKSGVIIEVNSEKTINLEQMRNQLKKAGFKNLLVQNFGSSHDVIIRMPLIQNNVTQKKFNKILDLINHENNQNIKIKRTECVGPNISKNLFENSSIALLVALICIFIYVNFRFEWKLATGSILALIHDIIITLGFLSLLNIEIDMTIVAALMSVIGYSLNDSIVVSDRIRENCRKISDIDIYHIFNISLTQTLSRTLITSITTLMVVLILLIFGGSVLRGFSITLFIGIFIGTFSSIYVVSALALKLDMTSNFLIQQKSEEQ